MQLYFCSYEGKIKETMAKHNGSEFWDVCLIIINLIYVLPICLLYIILKIENQI